MNIYLIDKIIAWLTLFSGLSISIVAIYYSVAGLVAIFAAAVIPIVIMGVALEVSKLVATLWLKWNWTKAPRLIKTYLIVAVVVLMFITSMGIFGFLSKAHIDQTASGLDTVARVEQITKEVARQNDLIARAEERIKKIETSGVGVDANVQRQIDTEQARIDSAYQRVQPAIVEQQRIIDNQLKLFQDELAKIDRELETLQGFINSGEIAKAQGMVGTKADGQYGPATAAAFTAWQKRKSDERASVIAKIESANNNPTVKAARDEIQRIRKGVETQIADANTLINRLRSQLGQTDSAEVDQLLTEQRTVITTATAEVDKLTSQKYELEAETRKLEAEVGPIKFIADFIYGDRTDKNTLEEAVRWMIVIIVAVFDPLAIVLLLASQHSFQWFRQIREQQVSDQLTNVVTPTTDEPKQNEDPVVEADEEPAYKQFPYLREEFAHFKTNYTDVITHSKEPEDSEVDEKEDQEVIANAHPSEKAAMQKWKIEHPGDSLKHQRRLYKDGLIDFLPWEKYIEDEEAAQEALKWVKEQEEKKRTIAWLERDGDHQIKKTKEQ